VTGKAPLFMEDTVEVFWLLWYRKGYVPT